MRKSWNKNVSQELIETGGAKLKEEVIRRLNKVSKSHLYQETGVSEYSRPAQVGYRLMGSELEGVKENKLSRQPVDCADYETI